MITITSEALLAAGYRAGPHYERVCNHTLYQKRVSDPRGAVLYFITFYIWHWHQHFPGAEHPHATTASVNARLYLDPKTTQGRAISTGGIDFEPILESDATIDEVETLMADAYRRLGCVPDLHNQP